MGKVILKLLQGILHLKRQHIPNKFFEQKREKVGQATRQPLGAAFTEGNCSEMTVYSKL